MQSSSGNLSSNPTGSRPNSRAGCGINPLGSFVGGPILVIIGIVIFYFFGGNFRQAHISSSWPTAQGRITHSEMVVDDYGPGSSRRVWYGLDITYDYMVDEQQYSSSHVTAFDVRTNHRTPIEDTVSRYPVGTIVTVYYDPEQPASSLLEPGIKGEVLFTGIVLASFPAVGLLAIVGGLIQSVLQRFSGE